MKNRTPKLPRGSYVSGRTLRLVRKEIDSWTGADRTHGNRVLQFLLRIKEEDQRYRRKFYGRRRRRWASDNSAELKAIKGLVKRAIDGQLKMSARLAKVEKKISTKKAR